MARKPNISSRSEQELNKAEKQLEKFTDQVKSLTIDEVSKAPVVEKEQQTLLSKREANAKEAPYIKPNRSIHSKEKFNEKFREDYENGRKYVKCIVENNEIIGESVQFWIKKWPGTSAEEYTVPVNKPVYIPRYVAEHLASRSYHRLVMQDKQPHEIVEGEPMGTMVAKETKHRIDCRTTEFGF